ILNDARPLGALACGLYFAGQAPACAVGWENQFPPDGGSLDKSYTILLVPDRDAKVKKIRLEHRMLVRVGLCFGVVVLALMGAVGMSKPLPAGGEGRMIADGDAKPGTADDVDLLKQLDNLDKKVKAQEQEARALKSYFEDQQALLASAPSIWPVRGWVTSDFSVRLDPYTGERVMHEGIDVATGMGTPVRAPADGTVVFAGLEGGYGHVLV